MPKRLILAATILCAMMLTLSSPAAAHSQFREGGSINCDNRYPHTCDVRGYVKTVKGKRAANTRSPFRHVGRSVRDKPAHVRTARAVEMPSERVAEILPHPEGCPRRAFCGCGAALKVFGRNIRSLWLAANWFRFPPAAAAPGMVAVRQHHVFVIERVISSRVVLAYDANGGGRKTWRHLRSIAGYSIRNPHQGAS